ncbi:hypothetical protein CBNA_1500 [Coxiella burnetii str. Namibia]|nr:hypothetical protein CBNA_1500 [Coxiella burnetii str. Namibia]
MTPSLRGGSISLGYLLKTYTFNRTRLTPRRLCGDKVQN